ncbi:MAG: hemerythrin domain-containing protein [Acidobacteria bacterium]|nr:hemerythrin domain-containing protein [Acidobacteriota bacterium]
MNNDLLQADHGDLDRLLIEARSHADGGDPDELFVAVDWFWARLAMHIRAEHVHLFPAVSRKEKEEAADGPIAKLIERLRHDHDILMREIAKIMKGLREMMFEDGRTVPDGTAERLFLIADLLKEHNAVEETEIYPLPAKILSEAEHQELLAAMKKELDNVPPRFQAKG